VLGDNFVSAGADDEQPSSAGCMPGTRVNVLSKFMKWVEEDPKRLFWLAGMAGTGKTSIAVTLCRKLRENTEVLFAGGYFCSRSAGSVARMDVRCILPTLAGLLADKSPEFASALAAELEQDRRVAHKPVSDQIGPLLERPLAALAAETRRIVFIVDALDECSNEREMEELLAAFAEFESESKVKFILMSRPETHIRGSRISDDSHTDILQLHTINTADVTEDVRIYISTTFAQNPLSKPWYFETDVTALAKLSNGLFIFASTIVTYILGNKSVQGRTTRLQTALKTVLSQSAVGRGPLDAMYEFIITRAADTSEIEPEELQATQRTLACILRGRMPLSVRALAELLELDTDVLLESLRRLHAAVHVPENINEPGLRTLHASFGDYLFSQASGHIHIPATLGHDILGKSCLRRMMQKDLCFNVSRSQSSFESNSETAPDCIPLSLIYACLHWARHISAASDPSGFEEEIGREFRPKFLPWLEVLSVIGSIGLASGLLLVATSVVS